MPVVIGGRNRWYVKTNVNLWLLIPSRWIKLHAMESYVSEKEAYAAVGKLGYLRSVSLRNWSSNTDTSRAPRQIVDGSGCSDHCRRLASVAETKRDWTGARRSIPTNDGVGTRQRAEVSFRCSRICSRTCRRSSFAWLWRRTSLPSRCVFFRFAIRFTMHWICLI